LAREKKKKKKRIIDKCKLVSLINFMGEQNDLSQLESECGESIEKRVLLTILLI